MHKAQCRLNERKKKSVLFGIVTSLAKHLYDTVSGTGNKMENVILWFYKIRRWLLGAVLVLWEGVARSRWWTGGCSMKTHPNYEDVSVIETKTRRRSAENRNFYRSRTLWMCFSNIRNTWSHWCVLKFWICLYLKRSTGKPRYFLFGQRRNGILQLATSTK